MTYRCHKYPNMKWILKKLQHSTVHFELYVINFLLNQTSISKSSFRWYATQNSDFYTTKKETLFLPSISHSLLIFCEEWEKYKRFLQSIFQRSILLQVVGKIRPTSHVCHASHVPYKMNFISRPLLRVPFYHYLPTMCNGQIKNQK